MTSRLSTVTVRIQMIVETSALALKEDVDLRLSLLSGLHSGLPKQGRHDDDNLKANGLGKRARERGG